MKLIVLLLTFMSLNCSEKAKPNIPPLDLDALQLLLKQRPKRLKYTPQQLKEIREKMHKKKNAQSDTLDNKKKK